MGQKLTSTHPISGFTLVELIVVITILVILGSIAFVNLGGFQSNARDSSRVSDLTNIAKGLDILYAKNNVVLPPENGTNLGVITLTASGTTIGFQGAIGQNILSAVKMSGDGKDPLDKKSYTYATNLGYTKYQLLSLFEDSSTSVASVGGIIDTVYAGYETRTPGVKGGQLGVLLSSDIGKLNQPIQENYSVGSFTGVDVAKTNSGYLAVLSSKNIITGTGSNLKRLEIIYPNNPKLDTTTITDIANGSLVGYWDMETVTSDSKLKDMSGNGNSLSPNGIAHSNVKGKIGKSYFFNTGGYLNGGANSSSLDILTNEVSLVAWFNPQVNVSSMTDAYPILIIKRPYQIGGYAAHFTKSSGTINIQYCFSGSFSSASYNTPLVTKWYHYVGVKSRNTFTIYIDGVLVSTGNTSTPMASSYGTELKIGQNFQGDIDEVRIYNRALSDTEVKTLYDATK